jgi:branched-chain amino acid transport system permease protein
LLILHPQLVAIARCCLLLAVLLQLAACEVRSSAGWALCEQALAVLEPGATQVQRSPTAVQDEVTLRYVALGRAQTLTCRIEPGAHRQPALRGLSSTREGELSPTALFFLQAFVLRRLTPVAAGLGPLPYLAQQLLNATAPAAIYALLALGYSLLYGLIGRINLAFGEFCAFGTLAALAGAHLLGEPSTWLAAGGAVLAAVPVGLALGAATHRLVLRPLLRRTSLAFLIATLGLSLALSEGLRLSQSGRTQWFPTGLSRPLTLWQGGDASVTVGTAQLAVLAIGLLAFAAVMLLMARSSFGRAWRACADDPGAAALVGVDVDRTVARSAMLAGALATLAGAAVALNYGIVGFEAGLLLGFKALTAAVVGGIGSPAGAMLGGAVIGIAETLWAGYVSGEWRDVVIFGVLACTLVFRPYGLLGQPFARDNPMLRQIGE